jgi:acetolactate synthase small subunit
MSMDQSSSPNIFTACYAVRALADPGSLPRLLEPFAKRGLVPSAMHVRSTGVISLVDLQVEGLDRATAELIAETLRQIVTVERVLLSPLAASGAARASA